MFAKVEEIRRDLRQRQSHRLPCAVSLVRLNLMFATFFAATAIQAFFDITFCLCFQVTFLLKSSH